MVGRADLLLSPLTITQLGAGPTITVTPSEYPDVAATPAGTVTPNIMLGGGAEGWSAVLGANPGGFLTLPADPSGMGSGTLNIRYSENLGVERMGEVVFTTNGGTGGPATFTLNNHAVRCWSDDYGYPCGLSRRCGYPRRDDYSYDCLGRWCGGLERCFGGESGRFSDASTDYERCG